MSDASVYADNYMITIHDMVAALEVDYDRIEELTDIRDDALSVEIRSDWGTVGDSLTPSEYRIVLTTGGPHLEIRGELDHYGEPCRAWLVYSDWGTPYTERVNQEGDEEALLAFSQCFYFGE